MSEFKELLRSRLKAKRLAMPAYDVEIKSRQIIHRLLGKVDWTDVKNFHIYKSLPEWKEVNTDFLVWEIKNRYPSAIVVQPSILGNDPLPSQMFDVIIVPVLGFDKNNYRLGLGAGWYDRFLATQPNAAKIGLCFYDGFVSHGLPHEPHDVRLDQIITEV